MVRIWSYDHQTIRRTISVVLLWSPRVLHACQDLPDLLVACSANRLHFWPHRKWLLWHLVMLRCYILQSFLWVSAVPPFQTACCNGGGVMAILKNDLKFWNCDLCHDLFFFPSSPSSSLCGGVLFILYSFLPIVLKVTNNSGVDYRICMPLNITESKVCWEFWSWLSISQDMLGVCSLFL